MKRDIIDWMILIVIFGCLAVVLFGCSPQKKLNRLLNKHPELRQNDTIEIRDTFTIDAIRYDTTVRLQLDTITIEKERLRIKTVRVNDSIYIEGECLEDTIYIEKKIPVEKIVVENPIVTVKRYAKKFWRIALGLSILLVVLSMVLRRR